MSFRFPAILGPQGETLAAVIDVFSLNCLACHTPVYPTQPMPAYALGPPYYGLIHHDCINNMQWHGQWPHAAPAGAYSSPTAHSTSPPHSAPRLGDRGSGQ